MELVQNNEYNEPVYWA